MSLKALAQRAFHVSGALSLIRRRNSRQVRVLTYHRFDPDAASDFEAQCVHIRRYYNPVPADAVADFIGGKPMPRNSIAITTDDGYRDFYLHAYPILRRYEIPATMFLMTGFVDGEVQPWWDQVHAAYRNTALAATCDEAIEKLKQMPNQQRLEFLRQLPATGVRSEAVTWDEVREMAANGITFGAHTKSHPILSTLETEAEIRDEIFGSRDRLTTELGHAPTLFCYPNGRARDIDERVVRAVRDAGYHAAFTTESGFNQPGQDPFRLKRISVDSPLPARYFAQQLAGFRI